MTRTLRFEWDVPDELFDERFQEEEFLTQLKEDAVMKLFTAGRLSSGYAASSAWDNAAELLKRLQKQGLPLVQYTEEDLTKDLAVMQKIDEELLGEPRQAEQND